MSPSLGEVPCFPLMLRTASSLQKAGQCSTSHSSPHLYMQIPDPTAFDHSLPKAITRSLCTARACLGTMKSKAGAKSKRPSSTEVIGNSWTTNMLLDSRDGMHYLLVRLVTYPSHVKQPSAVKVTLCCLSSLSCHHLHFPPTLMRGGHQILHKKQEDQSKSKFI